MKTKFEDFLNEYKEAFNVEKALKEVIGKAFGEEKCDCKTIINKIYKESENGTLPTAIKKVVKEYPELKDFEKELIAVLEDQID
jgi:phage FluMu protein Com